MADAATVILTVPTAADATAAGTILGGWIMTQLDHAAGRAGRRFAGDCVIRAIRDLQFLSPLQLGEDFAVQASLGRTGRTSFVLNLTGTARPETDQARAVITAEVTMICIGADGQPRPIAA